MVLYKSVWCYNVVCYLQVCGWVGVVWWEGVVWGVGVVSGGGGAKNCLIGNPLALSYKAIIGPPHHPPPPPLRIVQK